MPAKDIYHEKIKSALIKEDWTITHDPLRLTWGTKDMYVDLGAEQLLAAEKTGRRIAVEVKSFVGASEMDDLEKAIGQYIVYRSVMGKTEPDIFNAWQNCVFLCASRWEGVAPLTDDGGTTPFQRKAQVMRLLSIERYILRFTTMCLSTSLKNRLANF